MKFGDRLAEIRKQKKLTQDQLGEGLGTDGADASKAVVLGWEKNRHFPRVDQLMMICEKLGTSADYLVFGKVPDSQMRPEVQEIAAALGRLTADQFSFAMQGIRYALEAAALKKPADQKDERKFDEPSSSLRRAL